MENPKVSIIIPVYNGSNFLKEAIDSALHQTYENIEVIVVNDGSCDNNATENIAYVYGDKIKYIKKENGGVSSALNLGIKNMQGEWFSWLSHDDVYHKEKVALQIANMKMLTETKRDVQNTLFYIQTDFINGSGEILNLHQQKIYQGDYNSDETLAKLLSGFRFNGCGFLLHRTLFDKVGFFDEGMRYLQDTYLWHQAFFNNYSLYVDDTKAVYSRVHEGQVTGSAAGLQHLEKEKIIFGDYIYNAVLCKNKDFRLLEKYMLLCYRRNNFSIAKKCYVYLNENKRLIMKIKLKAWVLYFYGRLRPYIRSVYYKFKYDIKR